MFNLNDITKNNMIEEIKLSVLIYNRIIIKEEMSNRLIELYNHSEENDEYRIFFKIISFIWLIKENELYDIMKEELKIKNGLLHKLINELSLNTNLYISIFYYY